MHIGKLKQSNLISVSWKGIIALSMAVLLTACSGSVKRLDTNEDVMLSDRWNDTDSRLVAEEMMGDMLTFPWFRDYNFSKKGNPTVIVQSIRNKTSEHIPVDTFINDIKRSLLRAGKVDFVVSGAERDDVRTEREEQELNAAPDTVAKFGLEQGAGFALSGTINSIVDSNGDQRVSFYQVDLKLIDMTTNREVWNGQKKIKKLADKGFF
ncbi:penicillin-binding protein activator LpoB [Marinomonas sp. A3A]|jgi:penicillin-binding protein activator|uniref:penicillin-binding protein activator LpoB n=1 Tax=Marinomonas sp. A3A TaxID=2065312 RepID=UPI001BB36269|nr:penicillin-binding protein activator LpoB [Marinomonas sp. A3A]QUX90534.1 penicillin-binding protein activator LpoB [Marinomonas sp. A3A]